MNLVNRAEVSGGDVIASLREFDRLHPAAFRQFVGYCKDGSGVFLPLEAIEAAKQFELMQSSGFGAIVPDEIRKIVNASVSSTYELQ